ncbi:MAG TPA: N-6 DNA methylase [Pyrinomonadaceae bacterium]|jgi:type I restriction-modification system DNA methylase subunit
MPLPFASPNLDTSYSTIYDSLGYLREVFHKSGRFDDSNAKLDEVVKLLSTYIAYKRGLLESFPQLHRTRTDKLIPELQRTFKQAARLPCYLNQAGGSIFGASPSLALRAGDETLAIDLLQLVENAVDIAFSNKEAGNPFDVLNEAFGHFVRDNFRGNIEDAQYMTPPEVVEFMVDLALADIEKEGIQLAGDEAFVVADPSCGVGSFLASFYHKAKTSKAFKNVSLHLVGQDKVERMVRLTKINLALFDVLQHTVTIGNSLVHGSPIDQLNGKVDLILTNPPFGAKFDRSDVQACGAENLPFFTAIAKENANVDSELLFVDRNLALLREGGRLLIVLPDGVISAKGLPGLLRQHLRMNALVHGIVELPSVTFGQAGTRTKTAVLYLQKRAKIKEFPKSVFIAKADSLGFEVSTRKGVQVKVSRGRNELPVILEAYRAAQQSNGATRILNESPSAVRTEYRDILNNSWTPNHYNAIRLRAMKRVAKATTLQGIPLGELVSFECESRRVESWQQGAVFISVLHVIGEGMLDVAGIREYAPKTPGIPIKPGEVLLSKINPRIPRVVVAPEIGEKMLCSTEFAVMRPHSDLDPYCLLFLLLSQLVQDQIKSLTSGTSASHNRIKTKELSQVKIPMPLAHSPAEKLLNNLVKEYRSSIENMLKETIKLTSLRASEDNWYSEN